MTKKREDSINNNHPHFYLYEDDMDADQHLGDSQKANETNSLLRLPKRQNLRSTKILNGSSTLTISTGASISNLRYPNMSPLIEITPDSNILSSRDRFDSMKDILKFPIESSHAYSYAHLSPNSLALRLNVLKRSLEILQERPGLFKSIKLSSSDKDGKDQSLSMSQDSNFNKPPRPFSLYQPPPANNSSEHFKDKYRLQSNASSAALAMLFRPEIKRSDSLPENQLYSTKDQKRSSTQFSFAYEKTSNDTILNDDLKDIITLLENDSSTLINNSEIASTLHDLSLSNNKDDQQLKQNFLKNKLLYALATPFVENTAMTSSLLGDTPNNAHPSTTALNLLNNIPPPTPTSNNSNRPFHSISSGKHSLPQSVFTVEIENPWFVKAANDLACLMFGVSQSMIKSLTLMDLIAPQFRNFVTDRLNRYTAGNLQLKSRNQENGSTNNIIFAGEIVAICRPGDKEYAWTSMWAKTKNNLIICMFDQIPCDAFDVVVSCMKGDPDQPYEVNLINDIAGKLMSQFDTSKFKKLSDISDSIDSDLKNKDKYEESDLLNYYASRDVADSENINQTRYYTLQLTGEENIPCAITSNPLEIHQDKYEIKLKIHSLPYIAGIFVIHSSNYHILSCNNAIAKNLFGRSAAELNEKSIDYLIPNFTNILKVGLDQNTDKFSIGSGLVLPEHFFRKYDAVLRHRQDQNFSEEKLFFNSHGIEGIHRDGRSIFVDVQLRVSSTETFVLWITYSRSNNKRPISKELDKLSSSASSLSLASGNDKTEFKRTRSVTHGYITSDVNLPSQLKLFQDNGSDLLELAPSSTEISRQNSTRKPKTDALSISISHLTTALEKNDSTKGRIVSNSDSTDTRMSDSPPPETASSEATTVPMICEGIPDYHILNSKNDLYRKYSEEEFLKVENDFLEHKMKSSTHWPSAVGTKRRTKKFSEFKVIRNLGEGAYGKVVLAQHKEDSVYQIIIKCIDKERILVDTWVRDRKLGTIPSEIQIMAFLNNEPHPNIMRIVDFFEDSKYYYLETPIFGNPPAIDLFDFIEIKKNMTELECQFIFKQIVMAIYHLHNHGIVHRDVKDENIIVDEHGIIKLIDFGSAGYTRSGPFDVFVGTIDYASPEVLRGEKYEGKPQDIWALGILLYTMIYKENPFYNVDEIMEGDLRIPFIVSEGSMRLIQKILVRDVKKRPTITDIVEDEWLKI